MTSEWLSANSTLVTALAGMASTVFVAIYMTSSHSRSAEAERRHNTRLLMLAERKSAYEKMLQAFEEFDDTLYMLLGCGYRAHGAARTRLTEEVRTLLDRNSKADLTIQDLERELELIAPLDVITACRTTFRALREKTQILKDEGDVRPQPYNAHLAETVRCMRSDLARLMRSDLGRIISNATDYPEEDFMSLYNELLAPENVLSGQG
jgi:hypothetical protein